MTPDPVACVSRSTGCCCRLKKRRNIGSCSNGLSSRTRPRTEIPTTPGVTRLTTGAMVCIGAPPTSGIGAPAWAEHAVIAVRTIPPDRTSAGKTGFIVVRTLGGDGAHSANDTPYLQVSAALYLTPRVTASREAPCRAWQHTR